MLVTRLRPLDVASCFRSGCLNRLFLSVVAKLSKALASTDGWLALAFLESAHPALDGHTPR